MINDDCIDLVGVGAFLAKLAVASEPELTDSTATPQAHDRLTKLNVAVGKSAARILARSRHDQGLAELRPGEIRQGLDFLGIMGE